MKSQKQVVTADAEDLEELPFNEIDKLQSCGINMADINKLKAAGMSTVLGVIMR